MKIIIDISMPRIDPLGGIFDLIWPLSYKKKIMYHCPKCDVLIEPYLEKCHNCKTELGWDDLKKQENEEA